MERYLSDYFTEIPEKLIHKSCYISVKRKRLTVSMEDKAIDVSFLEACPPKLTSDTPSILFLHGDAFTAQIWDDIGTLTLLGALGWRAVAIDLPEYGSTRGGRVYDTAQFIDLVLEGMDMECPVLVSPSMSGRFSIPFLLKHSSDQEQRIKAFISIAPDNTEQFLIDKRTKDIEIPSFTVYGSKDEEVGGSAARNMVGIHNQMAYRIAEAGHACYVNESDQWHLLLYNLLTKLRK